MKKSLQKNSTALLLILATGIVPGCQKKTDAATELERTVKTLAATPAPVAPTTPSSGLPGPTVSAEVGQALTAFKSGNYSDAIGHMEMARTHPARTGAETMAVQDAMAAVMADLYTRAANGDAVAQQAIKQYQENRNRH
jgi:hypothetical protein